MQNGVILYAVGQFKKSRKLLKQTFWSKNAGYFGSMIGSYEMISGTGRHVTNKREQVREGQVEI